MMQILFFAATLVASFEAMATFPPAYEKAMQAKVDEMTAASVSGISTFTHAQPFKRNRRTQHFRIYYIIDKPHWLQLFCKQILTARRQKLQAFLAKLYMPI